VEDRPCAVDDAPRSVKTAGFSAEPLVLQAGRP
jgi:hypothetical protein